MVRFTNAASPYSYPYSIGNLSLKHLVESDTWDFTFELTARNPWGEALGSTTCHTTWCVVPTTQVLKHIHAKNNKS
jgi:hypothetical protein